MKYIVVILVMAISSTTIGQNSMDRLGKFESTYQKSKQVVSTQNIRVNFTLVYGNGKRESLETSSNVLTLTNQSSQGKLKTLSKQNSTINLDGNVENYQVRFDDSKKYIEISYDLLTNVEKKEVNIGIKPNGGVVLVVFPNSEGSISWLGTLN